MTTTDLGRRDFLKLLGIGGAGIAVTASIPGAAQHLFATRPTIEMPPSPRVLLGHRHFVYDLSQRPPPPEVIRSLTLAGNRAGKTGMATNLLRLHARAKATYLIQLDDGAVGSILMGATGRTIYDNGWTPSTAGTRIDYEVDATPARGEDPHISFYKGAMDLRDRIADDTAELASGFRGTLITVVDMPIMAVPKPDTGFWITSTIGQFLVQDSDVVDWGNPVSQNGEVPIETPNMIEMKMLNLVDRELISMGVISDFRNQHHRKPSTDEVRTAFGRVWNKRGGLYA